MPEWPRARFVALTVLVATAVLLFDISLPLGVAAGVPYLALVLLGQWFPGTRHILVLAVFASLLTWLGYFLSPQGGVHWVVLTNRMLALFAIWVSAILLIHLKRGQQRLSQINDKLQQYVDIVDEHVITSSTDRLGTITSASEAFCRISGYSKEELIGKSHNIVRHPDMPKSLYKDMWQTILAGAEWQGEIKNRKKDGSHYWVSVHIVPLKDGSGFTAVRQDITDRKWVEVLSITDNLTQLYNRMKLDEELRQELGRAERYGNAFSIILLDIDHFKRVNDTYGHQVGDQVLTHMGNIIRSTVRRSDIAGRWGGEEFLVVCPNTPMQSALELAERLREAIADFLFPVAGNCSSSFGVATYHKGENEAAIIRRADAALYQAKESGRNRVEAAEE